jgi:tripeptidyl-peptidase-1
VRTTSYSLPEHLHVHIDVIQPTTMFARVSRESTDYILFDDGIEVEDEPPVLASPTTSGTAVNPSCTTTVTVDCLKQIYNATGYTPLNHGKNGIGINGFLGQFANIQDLQSFYAEQVPLAVNTSFEFVSVNGESRHETDIK